MIKGDIIKFGNYSWLVLKIKDGRALIITQDIIELRWYHNEFVDITWADCGLRNYLNHEFYNQFNQEEKARIIAVTNINAYNPWFNTKGVLILLTGYFYLAFRKFVSILAAAKIYPIKADKNGL